MGCIPCSPPPPLPRSLGSAGRGWGRKGGAETRREAETGTGGRRLGLSGRSLGRGAERGRGLRRLGWGAETRAGRWCLRQIKKRRGRTLKTRIRGKQRNKKKRSRSKVGREREEEREGRKEKAGGGGNDCYGTRFVPRSGSQVPLRCCSTISLEPDYRG